MTRVDSLATFSSLYADRVLVRNPLLRARSYGWDVAICVEVLFYLEPFFRAGVLGFAWDDFPTCIHHHEHDVAPLTRAIAPLRQTLSHRFLTECEWHLEKADGFPRLVLVGPEDLVPHGEMAFGLFHPHYENACSRTPTNVALTADQLALFDQPDQAIRPIVDDFFIQSMYSRWSRCRQLGDSEATFRLLEHLNPERQRFRTDLVKAFRHTLPVLGQVPPDKILELRMREPEAFSLYRGALQKTLSIADAHPDALDELFNDTVRTELDRMTLTIKNWRSRIAKTLATDIAVTAGYVTVGLAGGFLPPDIVTALGGLKAAKDVGQSVKDFFAGPPEFSESEFYFLWKLEQRYGSKSRGKVT